LLVASHNHLWATFAGMDATESSYAVWQQLRSQQMMEKSIVRQIYVRKQQLAVATAMQLVDSTGLFFSTSVKNELSSFSHFVHPFQIDPSIHQSNSYGISLGANSIRTILASSMTIMRGTQSLIPYAKITGQCNCLSDKIFARMDVTIGGVVLLLMPFVPHMSVAYQRCIRASHTRMEQERMMCRRPTMITMMINLSLKG